jgi:hypothetical protein
LVLLENCQEPTITTVGNTEDCLKRGEDKGKVEGNFGTQAPKKCKCVELEEAGYSVVMEFRGKKLAIQYVCD